MQNLSGKSIPLLISKLKTNIMTSQRNRGGDDVWRKREEIKDELARRGADALEPLLDMLTRYDEDSANHAADIIGRIADPAAVVPLAKLLADPHPPYVKRAATRALTAINTPEAMLAVNIWQGWQSRVREMVQDYIRNQTAAPELVQRLAAVAARHSATPEKIADAYLLMTTEQSLSQDAAARLRALPLSPEECAMIESVATP